MTIYRISMYAKATAAQLVAIDIDVASFAHFSALGTWSKSKGLCPGCQASSQDYIEPLLVQWEPSSDVIGDFSWDGPYGYLSIVTEPVAGFLRQHAFECMFLDVEYVAPEKPRGRSKCVPYPYTGPKQFWVKSKTFLDLDLDASNVVLEEDCPLCGRQDYTFRYEGIVIPRSNWHGEKMFRIRTNGRSLATFVTEEGRQLIEGEKFSNVAFRPAGVIRE